MHLAFKNDTELIKSLKNGEAKAYSFLVDHYHHRLCLYAFSFTNDYNNSEDIVQNIFVYLWKNRLKLKDSFSVKSYLYRSVYNECIDVYRKTKAITALEKKYIDALNYIVEEESENTLEKYIDLVKREIGNLPPKCQQIFILSKKEGLTNVEISEYLNISIKTVEGQITKGFKILKEKLGDKYETILFFLFPKKSIKTHVFSKSL